MKKAQYMLCLPALLAFFSAVPAGAQTATPLTITVVASEDAYEGNALMGLDINGSEMTQTAITAIHSQGQWQSFTYVIPSPQDFQSIGVSFLNDAARAGVGDRNLYIQSITVNGYVLTPGQGTYIRSLNGQTEQTNGAMYWQGTLTWDASLLSALSTPLLTISVVASEEAYDGDAMMGIDINGVQLTQTAITAIHSQGQWQTVSYAVPMPEDLQTISVSFLNDAARAGVGDRNLYIQSLSVNGYVLTPGQGTYIRSLNGQTEQTNGAMYWDGTLSWGMSSIPIVDMQFSNQDVIEDLGYAVRNPSDPYYFDIAMPEAPSGVDRVQLRAEPGTDFTVWLDQNTPSGSGQTGSEEVSQSLGLKITSTYQEAVKDKIMLSPVLYSYNDAILIDSQDTLRFVSFDFMLDPSYQNPQGWLIHMQAWQGTGFSPPFTIQAAPNNDAMANVQFMFNIRDDAIQTAQFESLKTIYTMPVSRGIWYNMVLELEPSFDGSPNPGLITAWLNGVQQFTYNGYWGYNPSSPPAWAPKADLPATWNAYDASEIGIEFGLYRGRQVTTQTIYFDNIRYGRTIESVTVPSQ
jgi:Ca-dependent carbohydrate-binding module xylan-binding/Polysaccharide lyase